MDTPTLCSPLADHPHAARYERDGLHEFVEEPLYQRLCRLTARHPAALALHEALPPGPLRPTLWLAALHERVLAGGLARPDALAHWFASVGAHRAVDDPALPAAFDAFVTRHAEVLRQHLARRGTQTNEVGRTRAARMASGAGCWPARTRTGAGWPGWVEGPGGAQGRRQGHWRLKAARSPAAPGRARARPAAQRPPARRRRWGRCGGHGPGAAG